MGAVFRAYDRLTGQYVALKQVKEVGKAIASGSAPTLTPTALRVTLTHEFQTLAALSHPHVINVMDYGFDDENNAFFTMQLLNEPRPLTRAAAEKPPAFKVRMLIEMLQALDYLHRRGMLHRDLKPDNALVDESDRVKVLDFGLAVFQEKLDPTSESFSGTLAYIAPELLQGWLPSAASDLFAVGVMGYELFAGRHPFEVANITVLIQDILLKEPDIADLDVDVEIGIIIMKLLAKRPEDRYQNARDVIRDLLRASKIDIDVETEEIRDSFLQTAPFTGREDEFALLAAALQRAVDGSGSALIIGGETGVGKTRLLDELRISALVRGMLVLRGQGVRGGGKPYQLWREPLRRMVLATEIDDLDAGVLKDLVPDIEQLLGRPVPTVTDLQGPAFQQRLLATIVSLFSQFKQPVLLILEDLQWASESLDVLKSLLPIVESLPLLVVGSFRREEHTKLADELPGAQLMTLNRLSPEAIAQISTSMLGEAGRRPDVLRLLQNETEGNVYFLVEVIRVLAEEAGDLSQIEQMDLPAKVAAGGIQEVMMRRLNRVPDESFELLQMAAVAGRELDLKVLAQAAPSVDIEYWLAICTNCAVLEALDEEWRFSHDRLRQTVLETIETADRPAMHRKIAEALESLHADAPEYAATIAEHWQAAGDREKELQYQREAGYYAFRLSALREARDHLWRALELLPEDRDTERVDFLIKLGEVEKFLGNYPAAKQHIELALAISGIIKDARREADAELELADVYFLQGVFDSALLHGRSSLDFFRQQHIELGIARALSRLGLIYAQKGDYNDAVQVCEESLEISRRLQDIPTIAQTITSLGVTFFTMGRFDDATRYFNEALEASRASRERRRVANALMNLGSLAGIKGNLDEAAGYFTESLRMFHEIGEQRYEATVIDNLGLVAMLREDYEAATGYLRRSLTLMRKVGNQNGLANTYVNLGHVAQKQHEDGRARGWYLRAIALAQRIDAKPVLLEGLVGLAKIHPKREEAAMFVGLAQKHEATSGETQQMAAELEQALRAALGDDVYEQAAEDGAQRDLNIIVEKLLAEYAEQLAGDIEESA